MSYIYRHVTVVKIIDGDTVSLSVDMGNKITWKENFRLQGVDTPERGQPRYAEAIEFLTEMLNLGISKIETYKPDKYGRWLADIYVPVTGGEQLVNAQLVTAGLAKAYFGGKKG